MSYLMNKVLDSQHVVLHSGCMITGLVFARLSVAYFELRSVDSQYEDKTIQM
jgi:hypothetical protein